MRRQIYIKTNRKQEVIDFYHIDPKSEITEIVLDNHDIADMLANYTNISKEFFENILDHGYYDYLNSETNDDLYQKLSIESKAALKKYAKEMYSSDDEFADEFDQDTFERLLEFDEELMDMVYDAYNAAWNADITGGIIEELKDSLNEASYKLLKDDDLFIRNLQASYEYSQKYNQVVVSFKTTPLIDLLVNDENGEYNEYNFSTIEEIAIYILSSVFMFTEPYDGFEDFDSDLYNGEIQSYVASKIAI